MLTLRGKDGGANKPNRKAHTIVSTSAEDFDKKWEELSSRRVGLERIYSTVDARDIQKAIRLFKYRQLDAEYFDGQSKTEFYLDIKNRWVSALQHPSSRVGTLFMVDIDDEKKEYGNIMKEISDNSIDIVLDYPTKNGRHLILKPFNPVLVSFTVLKNHMILLEY